MEESSLVKLIKKNYAWLIAVFTFLGVFLSNVFKFVEYLIGRMYFAYYGLDINLYKYSDRGFFYSLCLGILMSFGLIFLFHCFYKIIKNINEKKIFNHNNFSYFMIILFINLYIAFNIKLNTNWITVLIYFLELLLYEMINVFFVFRIVKYKNEKYISQELFSFIKRLPLLLFIFLVSSGFLVRISLNNLDRYRIIDDDTVIVYSNTDYYLTLECEIVDDTLIMYKGTQTKISTEDVYTEYMEFKDVVVKGFKE